MNFKIDMDRETVSKLVDAYKLISDILHGTKEPLTDELRDALIRKASNYYFRREDKAMSISELCNYSYEGSACGCLGARNGDPLCGCRMFAALQDHKYDIALYIIDNQRIIGHENE